MSFFAMAAVGLAAVILLIGVWLTGVNTATHYEKRLGVCFPLLVYTASPFLLAAADSPAWAGDVAQLHGLSAYGVAATYYGTIMLTLRGLVGFCTDVAGAASLLTQGPKD
jgi:hypothetical protein